MKGLITLLAYPVCPYSNIYPTRLYFPSSSLHVSGIQLHELDGA